MSRKRQWEQIFSEKSSLGVSWHHKHPVLSLQLISESVAPPHARIIDVGGGGSLLADALLKAGYRNLAVLDISGLALSHVKRHLRSQAQAVEWFEADITEFVAPHRFDLWHDRAVFHFLTDPTDRLRYVGVLKRTLEPGGQVIIGAFAPGGPRQCSGLDVVQYDARKLCRVLGGDFRLLEEAAEIHLTPQGKKQHFAYFRLQYRGSRL